NLIFLITRPFLSDGVQRGWVGVVVGPTADEKVVVGAAVERVGPHATDEQIAAGEAPQDVCRVIAHKSVAERAAGRVFEVADPTRQPRGRAGEQVDGHAAWICRVVERIAAGAAVEGKSDRRGALQSERVIAGAAQDSNRRAGWQATQVDC